MHSQPTIAPQSSDVSTPTLKAALWDMDGTLVDTEPYWIAAETELVTSHGGEWDDERALGLVGRALDDSAAILQEAGVRMTVREIIDFLTGRVVAEIRREVPWRPGARELLHDLHTSGVRCALVTMSEGPLAQEIVDALPAPYFEFLVTGDQVSRGKPDPEPYLLAVERLRQADPALTIADCVALEDSVPGVASAMAAGLATIGIPHAVPLPADDNRITWETLAGSTADHVRRAVAERNFRGAAL